MTRCMFVLSLVVLAIGPGGALASYCPSGNPGEILCEDFDTYCAPGQYPGGAGVPMGTVCPPGTPAAGNDANLRAVWAQTSYIDESPSALCGTAAILDDSLMIAPDYYPTSLPFAGKYFNRMGSGESSYTVPIAQHTFKDWDTGELNLSRFTGNAFGDSRYVAVEGTDDAPLVLSFEFNSERTGKVFYSDGFMELAFGPPNDPLNRANTDYVKTPNCSVTCNKTLTSGPHSVVCAMGNPADVPPAGGLPYETCPSVVTNPPPVHNAIAAGVLPMLDPYPCHCNDGAVHGGNIYNPVFFDGQLWWMLGTNSPYPTTGTITPLNGATMPTPTIPTDPLGVHQGGSFLLWGGPIRAPKNWLTLTVKKDTIKIEMRTIETSRSTGFYGMQYEIYSVMDNIPRKYKGPFDSLRSGVSPGCELAGNTSWTTCATGKPRSCLTSMNAQARYVEFDDISLYGGYPWKPEGACCLSPSGGCLEDISQADCQTQEGGTFRGSNTSCSTEVCCPTPYADADVDGDIDATDFGVLQTCLTGDTIATSGKCSCFDHNGDGKINAQDVESFVICAAGPAITLETVPPECMP